VTALAAEAVGERLAGRQPSRGRALLVAGAAGVATAVFVYRLLRSGEPTTKGG
jgi:hypothetical protein